MTKYLIILGIAMALMAFMMVYLSQIARNIGLVDKPSTRKLHTREVPLIGGIGIGTIFFLSMLLMPFSLRDYRFMFFSGSLLLIIGILDDRRDTPAFAKLLGQAGVCVILVTLGDLRVSEIGDIFALGIDQGLSILAVPFTILGLVAVINAFNMIDGHDGLAGGTCLISLTALAFLCYRAGLWDSFGILILLSGLVGIFLLFNLEIFGVTRQVFLGDAGSMFLGLMLGIFLIRLNDWPMPENIVGLGDVLLKTTAAPWIIGLPLADMISSMCRRLFGYQPVMQADRGHIHHRLDSLGYHRLTTLMVLLCVHAMFALVGVLGTLQDWPDVYLFWTPLILISVYVSHDVYRQKKLFARSWKKD